MDKTLNQRFLPEIKAINEKLFAFNQFLAPASRVPLLDAERMIEEKSCVQILHGKWNDFSWPNPDKRGVYFILGHEMREDKNGIYIGKASFNSVMGSRLDCHLRPHKNSDQFIMDGYRNERYILDYIVTINLDRLDIGFFASALEEYLITRLNANLNLLNGIGN
jgi:hypothetical protein